MWPTVQRRGPQLPTLDAAGTEATKLPEAGLTAMDGEDMANLGPAGRQAWYARSLAKLHDQIDERAAKRPVCCASRGGTSRRPPPSSPASSRR